MANFLPPKVQALADQSLPCLNVVFNFVVTQYSLAPPLKLPWRGHTLTADNSLSQAQERVACLNMAANAFGHMPLLYSFVKADPVLYRDNVSIYRKEYRKMEFTGS